MTRLVLLTLLAVCVPLRVIAKCADGFYIATGKVVLDNGEPAAGAIVGASWVESGSPGGPAVGTADAKGNYTLYIHFQKYSGQSARGDECNGKLSEIAMRGYTDRLQSMSFQVPVRPGKDDRLKLPTFPIQFPRDGL